MPILAHAHARIAERRVGQESRRRLSDPGPDSWQAVVLGVTLAVLIFASPMLLPLCACKATNAGLDSELLFLSGNPALTEDSRAWGAPYRATPISGGAETHIPLIAGKHYGFSGNNAG